MAINLKRVSGSPVTVESNDFMTALYTASGDLLLAGPGILFNASTIGSVCKAIIQNQREDPGFGQGDMFILNDPYLGVAHQQDMAVVSPIYREGELVAWSGSVTHLSDIGGMEAGSWCYRAQDVFQEGLRVPGLRFVEKGKVRKDIFNMILAQSRDPHMVALDLKAQIAANNTASSRFNDLIARYGLETIYRLTADLIDYSELKLNKKLERIPDGTWRTKQYLDDGERIYKVQLALQKSRNRLDFDFEGTSNQARGFVNCTLHGTRGGVFVPLFALLCFDIPWTEGVLRPVSVQAPKGSLVNPNFPAPTSMASVSGVQVVMNASTVVVSKMLAAAPETQTESTAVWRGSVFPPRLHGRMKTGRFVVGQIMDGMAGGCGARSFKDGVDTGGTLHGVRPLCPNVETNEMRFPVLYLFRRQRRDSGGPGRYRGGLGGEDGYVIHGAQNDKLSILYAGMGFEVPQSSGILGGIPAPASANLIIRGSNIRDVLTGGRIPQDLGEVAGRVETLRPQTETDLLQDDVAYYAWVGGGGYGDPLTREPDLVLSDVVAGRVSAEAARAFYGVVFRPGPLVDMGGTQALRNEIRRERLGRQPEDTAARRDGGGPGSGSGLSCSNCGFAISVDGDSWNYVYRTRTLFDSKLVRAESSPLLLREFICPSCAALLETEVSMHDEPPSLDSIPQ